MHPLAKKLLMSRQLKLEEGEISVLGDINILLPVDFIVQLGQAMPNDKIYELGKNVGIHTSNRLTKVGLKSQKLGEFTLDLLSMNGWGKFSVLRLNSNQIIIHVNDSIIAKKHIELKIKKEEPCIFLSGLLAGVWSTAFDTDFYSKETQCAALRSKICEFTLKK